MAYKLRCLDMFGRIIASVATNKLAQLEIKLLIRAVLVGDTTMQTDMRLLDYLAYLCAESDMFARGYAHWVPMQSSYLLLKNQLHLWLDSAHQTRVPHQWPETE